MLLIDTPNSFKAFLKSINAETAAETDSFIAVDTEFIREDSEKPLLCLIQIATRNNVYIIDPMATDIAPLEQIFGNSAVRKVFHAAAQDLEILALYGINVENVRDTQICEAVLSTDYGLGYKALVRKYLNVKLEKNLVMSDWRRRPLSEEQLQYSADDVFYLHRVYEIQHRRLIELKREDWAEKERTSKKYDPFYERLSENKRLLYDQLRDWREKKALEKKLRPEAVVSDEILKSVCRKGPDFIQNIKNSRHGGTETLKEFLLFAEKIADGSEPEENHFERNITINLLKTLLWVCAREHSVAPSLIATGGDLEKLLNGDKDVECLSGWRQEVFGKYAKLLLNGELSLKINELLKVGTATTK
ncbi:MAG: HRDC domain-containing protein [Holosporaceae bacterium]|jgi:ribonuclease D|nr:HRDC domain-containing protein [Holosporaceae bacterium]